MQVENNTADLLEFYYQAKWKGTIPEPPGGWGIHAQKSNYAKASHAISILKTYCWQNFESKCLTDFQYEKKFILLNPKDHSKDELKLFKLHQVILNLLQVINSETFIPHSSFRSNKISECINSLPKFPFKFICTDGVVELSCLEQAYLSQDSIYFRSIFSLENYEESKRREMNYPDLTVSELEVICKTWCTNEVQVDQENFLELVLLADRFLLSTKDDYLINQLKSVALSGNKTQNQQIRDSLNQAFYDIKPSCSWISELISYLNTNT